MIGDIEREPMLQSKKIQVRVHQLNPWSSSHTLWGLVFQPPNTGCFKAFCKGVQISPKQRCLDHFGRLGNSWKNLSFFGSKKNGEIFSTTKHPILALVFGGMSEPERLDHLDFGHQLHHETPLEFRVTDISLPADTFESMILGCVSFLL